MIEWQTVRCIKQHAYSGKMRELGSVYDMKPRYAKLLSQQGKVEFVTDEVVPVKKVVKKRKK